MGVLCYSCSWGRVGTENSASWSHYVPLAAPHDQGVRIDRASMQWGGSSSSSSSAVDAASGNITVDNVVAGL